MVRAVARVDPREGGDPRDVLHRIAALALRLLQGRAAFVNLLDDQAVYARASAGDPGLALETPGSLDASICTALVRTGQAAVIPDLAAEPAFRSHPARRRGISAYIGVPLRTASGYTVGTLCVVDDRPHAWGPPDLETLADLARGVEAAVERAALESEVERRRVAEAALEERTELAHMTAEISMILARNLRPAVALQACAEVVVARTAAAFARIWTLNEEEQVLELRASAGMYTHLDGPHGRVPVGRFKIGLIAAERAPHLTNSVVGDPRVSDQAWARREGMVAFAGYPLSLDERVVGVIALFARHPLSNATIAMLEAAANAVAVGLARVEAQDRAEDQAIELDAQMQELTAQAEQLKAQAVQLEEANVELSALNRDLRARIEEVQLLSGALGRSESRFREIAETIPVQVWTATPAGLLDYVTERCAAYFGHTPDEVVGAGWQGVVHPDDLPGAVERWIRSLTSGETYTVEFRLLHAESDSYRWHLGRAVPLRGEGGVIERWFGTNTDIHDEKLAQQERDQARAEAEEARRVAQAASEAKTRFLNIMSHELRTPLGAIGGYVDLLDAEIPGPLTEQQRAYLKRVRYNETHLLSLVNELLDLAKIESGEFQLELTDAEIGPLVGSAELMIEPQMLGRQLRLEVQHADADLRVRADRDRVEQIVLNLLSNAVKYSPAEGTVRIRTGPAGDAVLVEVADGGIGIPADKLDAIFESFIQVDSPENRTQTGTGLGLAISRNLARAMGGDLTVRSEMGAGSTFALTLPRAAT